MRCRGAGSANRVLLLLLLEEWQGMERGGVGGWLGGWLGSLRGRGAVPVSQALGCVAEDGQGLGDGVQGGSCQILVQGIETYGLRRRLRRSLDNQGCRGGSSTC